MASLIRWTLKDLRECIERMTSPDVKFDMVCFIEGNRGLGKSTLGYKILNGLKVEKPFKPTRDIVYTREETLKHLSTKVNGCIMSDEMINVAYKRDFYIEDQKELLKAFDMYRDSRNIFIGCIPKFVDLDTKIQALCKLRITVVRRGIAIIHMKNKSIYSQDPWDIRSNQKIESKWSIRRLSKPRYGQLTTVRGILKFGDLPPEQRVLYDKIKEEKRNHVFSKYQSEELLKDPKEIFLNNLFNELRSGSLTREKLMLICKVNNKEFTSIRNQLNKKLRDAHDPKKFKDYCLSEKQKKKKDILGFTQPETLRFEESTVKQDKSSMENIDTNTQNVDIFEFKS